MKMTNESRDKIDVEGWYVGEFVKFVTARADGSPLQTDPNKPDYMLMVLKATRGPFAGYEHAESVMFKHFWKVKPLLEALGVEYEEDEDGSVNFDEDECAGAAVAFHIVQNKNYFNLSADKQSPSKSSIISLEEASELVANGDIVIPHFEDEGDEGGESGDDSDDLDY